LKQSITFYVDGSADLDMYIHLRALTKVKIEHALC
jgi:hypothetical protein